MKPSDTSALPPMTLGQQRFAIAIFFLIGVGLTAFALLDPLGLIGRPAAGVDTPAAAEYFCPMHPEVRQPQPGICSICKMDLEPASDGTAEVAVGGTLYQCPMHPQVIEENPGDCPICEMTLQPIEAQGAAIRIDPVQIQNIGVVSEPARRGEIARAVRTVGILDFNADRITWVNTKFSGWIEKVHRNYVGDRVQRGAPLFDIYSPELVTTQEEYLRALDYLDSLEGSGRAETVRQARDLLRSTRDRMSYWDVDEDQIAELEQSREVARVLTVRSPADGVIAEILDDALEGRFIERGRDLYKIADLRSLWVHADVFEADLPWIREGQTAEIVFRNDPERPVRGEVLFLYPEVDQKTRTLKICVQVPNEDGRLRAGMFADVSIEGPPVRNAVIIPDTAVLRSGERNLVFVDLGEGRFDPREVVLGTRGDDDTVQVLDGIEEGDAVVTQAQFMLDSESRVREAIAKFGARGSAAGHDHGAGEQQR